MQLLAYAHLIETYAETCGMTLKYIESTAELYLYTYIPVGNSYLPLKPVKVNSATTNPFSPPSVFLPLPLSTTISGA